MLLTTASLASLVVFVGARTGEVKFVAADLAILFFLLEAL